MAGGGNQKTGGGALEDLVEKPRRTVNTGTTTIMISRGIYDEKRGRNVFNGEGIEYLGTGGGQQKARTVRYRKRDLVPSLSSFGFASEVCFKGQGGRSYHGVMRTGLNRPSRKQLARKI